MLLLEVAFVSVHGLPLKVPVEDVENVTVPLGAEAVPAGWVSVTVAVQIVATPARTVLGLQVTVVLVPRVAFRAKDEAVLSLLLCMALPP